MTKPITEKIALALQRIDRAVREWQPIAVFGLFSGGHDSFSACYVASQHPAFTAAVHINTGIGIEATREYVLRTAQERGWKLLEYRADQNTYADGRPNPQLYEDLVRNKGGFPGPGRHQMMYIRLKERQLERLQRDYKASCPERRVMYVSGCRSQESERRMGNTKEVQVDGQRIWCAAIHDWSKGDTSDLLQHVGQPRNPIVDLIHKSGECLCGAFAKKGELEELRLWPETRPAYERIKAIEAEIVPKYGRGWGERPFKDKYTKINTGMLCWSCDKASEV